MLWRIGEWWTRSCWGWLAVIGPILCYVILWVTLDLVGLGAGNPIALKLDADDFRDARELDLHGVAGRLEYAIASALLLIVAVFSILWAVPRILVRIRNPFGGVTGLVIAFGISAALYLLYIESSYELRQIFADDILRAGEAEGVLQPWGLSIMGFSPMQLTLAPSQALEWSRDGIYLFSNAAPWCLIVLAACASSYEPRRFREEPPEQLRERLVLLQIAVLLAAANIVLSVAYTRAMVHWPPLLLEEDLAQAYTLATSRYAALWGAIGTVLLVAALAPAYVGLIKQFDRVATRELAEDLGRPPTYQERLQWREKHGLLISVQQAVTTGAAVVAPVLTGPTLDAQGDGALTDDPQQARQEIRIDQR